METPQRLPEWLRRPIQTDAAYAEVQRLLKAQHLHTVCEEAKCPNRHECWNHGTATFMILGAVCTRNCRFCNVAAGKPAPPDPQEPERIAEAAAQMKLRYIVLTSVTRDDLPDGGAAHFAATIQALRWRIPEAEVEVLTPDFQGEEAPLRTVLDAGPAVFNHNIETVERLQAPIRKVASYARSLGVLKRASEYAGDRVRVKSGIMLGLGETDEEVLQAFRDLFDHGVRLLTI
jgi:lipoic acid synthetase